jgi:MFS family permease
MTSKASSFFGWHVVAATFLLAMFGWGVGFYGPPIYLLMVVQRTGWPVAFVSAAVTMHFLIGAVVVANLPRLYRRWGVPVTTFAGAVVLAMGVGGWSLASQPWHLFAAALLSGSGWVAMGAAAVNAIVAPWFIRKRPAALSMAYNGASVGGVVFSPLWVVLIAWSGFSQAAMIIGISMAATVAVLSALVFSKSPEALGQSPDGAKSNQVETLAASSPAPSLPRSLLWRDRRFITLSAGMAAGLFAQIGLLAHLFSIADRRLIASASYGVQVIGSITLLLAGGDHAAMIAGVLLFGLGIGNATSLPPLIAQVEFDKADVSRVVPLIVALSQATYALAPAVFGIVRTISEPGVFILAAAIQLVAVATFVYGRQK